MTGVLCLAGTLQVGMQNADGRNENDLVVPKRVKHKVVI